jgi:tetratricopeptide (TPR) repeat protein
MSPAIIGCPQPHVLRLMLDDELEGPVSESVESHVSSCEACQKVLELLTQADPISDVSTLWSGPNHPAAPAAADTPTLDEPRSQLPPTRPDTASAGTEAAGPPSEVPGYAIERELGRGGMGVVYLAEQRSLGRQVALKMLGSGPRRPEEVLRFRLEAESLARLRHPGIVRIFEVGTIGDRPFLSMEFVAGGSLAERLAASALAPADAAGLVETLARAVHAAHQCGLIHRDLKPSNVLLDTDPASPAAAPLPKITDFGLAKQVGADSGLTHTGQILGTPSYMAPEQASGDRPVGILADVYALGAILYEALAGRPPFLGSTPWETMMKVVHEPPVPPSRLRDGIPRDLETIGLKCLAKRPADRYASADALANDLRRWREGRPISARPAGPVRRIGLWARRHPAYASMSVLLALSILAGAAGVAAQWLRAERNLERSKRRLDLAMTAIERFYAGVSHDATLQSPELNDLRLSLLGTTLEFYRSLRDEMEAGGGSDPASLTQMAEVISRLGRLNGEIGHEAEARESYAQAIGMARRLLQQAPKDPELRRVLAGSLAAASEIDIQTSRPEPAREALTTALGLFDSLARDQPRRPEVLDGRASCLHLMGDLECDAQQYETAERHYLEAIAIRERLVAVHPEQVDFLNNLGGTESNLAILYAQWNRLDQAGRWFREALRRRRELVARSDGPANRRKLGSCLNNLASFCLNTNDASEAPPLYDQARVIQERLAREHPTVPLYLNDLAVTFENLALSEEAAGRWPSARAHNVRALEVRERLAAEHPELLDAQAGLIRTHIGLSNADFEAFDFVRAEAEARAAVAAASRAEGVHAGSSDFLQQQADAYRALGDALHGAGQSAQADAAYSQALAIFDRNGKESRSAHIRADRVVALTHRGASRIQVGRQADGQADLKQAQALADELLREEPEEVTRHRNDSIAARLFLADSDLHRLRRHRGDDAAALRETADSYGRLADEAQKLLEQEPDENATHNHLSHALAGRAQALDAAGDLDQALTLWDQALAVATPLWRPRIELGRARTLCRLGRVDEALALARSAAERPVDARLEGMAMARLKALAFAAHPGPVPDPDREPLAAQAVAHLAALASGPRRGDGKALLHLIDDPDLDPLRTRPDYQRLAADLGFPADPFGP